MSSHAGISEDERSLDSASQIGSATSSRAPSRRQSHHPESPQKRRRLESVVSSRHAEWAFDFNDKYRLLFNEEAIRVAGNSKADDAVHHKRVQIGTSEWSVLEQSNFFAALGRFGRDQIPGIAEAVRTKSESETRDFLLSLQDAAARQGETDLMLRDVPAAIEIGRHCTEQLENLGEALARYQESLDAAQEQMRYGSNWLINSTLADEIEDAVNGTTRPGTAERGGRGIAGSCNYCKRRKLKCNRGDPCSNCFKSKVDCTYPERQSKAPKMDDATPRASPAENATSLLQKIPQAGLLQPSVMLQLSRDVFMNRSPDDLSPWDHWMQCTSDVATEPSIFRTAFNDLHDLAISITRRLVKCTLMQSASRLRAARIGRAGRERLPRVRTRDVLTAVDVLGLKRNGHERWVGVPRRCGLRLYETQLTASGRRRTMIPLKEAESILRASSPSRGTTSEPTSPIGPETFKSKAARSGTPLPLQDLAISDSEDDYMPGQGSNDEHSDIDDDLSEIDDDVQRNTARVRDDMGRFTSAPPRATGQDQNNTLLTLEAFDQEARQQEEQALQEMLGFEVIPKKQEVEDNDHNESTEKIVTDADDWRKYTTYKNEWEDTHGSVPLADLMANRKSPSSEPEATQHERLSQHQHARSLADDSDDNMDSGEGKIELPIYNTSTYAALHSAGFKDTDDEDDEESDELEQDAANIPKQSIEVDDKGIDVDRSGSDMDWK